MSTIHLGFEVGTGEPVGIPLKHLAVTGQTQESGKTTTLEALVSRAGLPALAFVTKRGETSFAGGRRIPPYFRDRADWQFVDQLLEAQLREKNKFLRPWIIKLCRDTRTLADVQAAVKKGLKKAKGISEGVYTQLDAYLDLIVPEIARAPLSRGIELSAGLNVMDVSGYQTPMQMLFVQSAIDWVNAHARGVITIVPEAWEFIPESKGSPVKASAVALVRKGAGLANFIWVDSQDMAGVAKEILRGCTVWLIGAQREANEIKRNLANIPADVEKPKAADIARLERGQFFACWKGVVKKVYVQPAWMNEAQARQVAEGALLADVAARLSPTRPRVEAQLAAVGPLEDCQKIAGGLPSLTADPYDDPPIPNEDLDMADVKRIEDKIDALSEFVRRGMNASPAVEPLAQVASAPPPELLRGALTAGDEDTLYQRFKARLLAEAPELLQVLLDRPEIHVKVERQMIEVAGDSLRGRLALLIRNGFFDQEQTGYAAWKELGRLGANPAKVSVYTELKELARMGFLTNEGEGYRTVAEMRKNIRESA